jgi:hypothetical protein
VCAICLRSLQIECGALQVQLIKDGNWGIAVVVSDSNRVVMTADCWYRPIVLDSDVAECMTLLVGMKFVKDVLFRGVEINSYSTNVVVVFNTDNMQHNYLRTIVLKCSITLIILLLHMLGEKLIKRLTI